jgi:octaprenyl-diphosphate synthase
MTLETIFEPILPDLQCVKESLNAQLTVLHEKQKINRKESASPFIQHFFNAPGKGLRPALVLLSAKLANPIRENDPSYQPLIQLATAVEFIHSASLVHDDVLDDAQQRRNQVSLNGKYGNKIAVLTGDTLFLQGFSLLFHLELDDWHKKQEIFQLLCDTTQKMCFGEILQQQLITDQRQAEREEYLTIVKNKTALLMSACCQCGAILAGKDHAASQHLAHFGLHFGLAFQLTDDFKDQDSLLDSDADLIALTREHAVTAKNHLQSFNGNRIAEHLTALCDFLVPINGAPHIFGGNA